MLFKKGYIQYMVKKHQAEKLIDFLFHNSAWFEITPFPADEYLVRCSRKYLDNIENYLLWNKGLGGDSE